MNENTQASKLRTQDPIVVPSPHDLAFIRQAMGVAVTVLFASHPQDVLRVFSHEELAEIIHQTKAHAKQGTTIEELYKGAWDRLGIFSGAIVAPEMSGRCVDDVVGVLSVRAGE